MTAEIDFAGERLTLLPARAAWWPRARTLFIADTHFGKPAAFRHAGVPVPETITDADAHRLESLCAALNPHHLVILGDFFHAPSGRVAQTESSLQAWRERHPSLRITLVRGNHDLTSGDPPAHWNFDCVDPGTSLGPFTLAHAPAPPEADPIRPTLCGHVHPGVILRGTSDALRLPCFFRAGPPDANGTLILPAFGRFTGLGILRPKKTDGVWVIADDTVTDVSPTHSAGLPQSCH
ncbi:MAG: ligase-associated DNA damage response endonuclease PdeM [Phycisphaerales bacterium]